ncbi:hypothetical protein JOC83_001872 [Bacillus iocasae]|uniref:Uncharacterized protein n=1 Tax=Priestia iocasae TaxID=2291674 RepID=A0ABS2QUD4_9BACI|nr:hypothetical protein [Metabacillus iocasae]
MYGQSYLVAIGHGAGVNKVGIRILVGINGVSIYEHTVNHLTAVLVTEKQSCSYFPKSIASYLHKLLKSSI